MNRKSLYCCPTILAALAATTAMGLAAPVRAQEAAEPQAEVAVVLEEAIEEDVSLSLDAPLLSLADEQVSTAETIVSVAEPEPPAAIEDAAGEQLAVTEPSLLTNSEVAVPEIAAEVAVASEVETVAAATGTATTPIPVWSSDAEIAPVLAGLVANGETETTLAQDSVAVAVELEESAAGTQLDGEVDLALGTEQLEADSSAIAPFEPTAELPVAIANLVQSADAELVDVESADAAPVDVQLAQVPTRPDAVPGAGDTGVSEAEQPRVLVAEVQVSGVDGNPEEELLLNAVYDSIQTRPGQPTTSSQLQEDLNSIFATGYFANVNFLPEDTPLGVRVRFIVDVNPVLNRVVAPETQVLPDEVVEQAFASQYGQTLNFNDLQDGVKRVNTWYQDNGFVLAQVVDATKITEDGTVNLQIAEGIVDSIDVRFLDADGNPTTETGEPVQGRTKSYIVTREFSLEPGDVFSRDEVEKSSQRVFGLGIFEDVRLSLNPAADDPSKVVVVVNVIEARSGSIGASGGVSSASGLFGSFSVGQENFRGRNQKLRSEITLGQRDFLFDVGFTDPWIKGDPFRTSYTVNAFRRRSISLIYSGGDKDVDLPNGDTPRILRTGGGLRFSRPLSKNVFEPAEWNASAGLQYQRVSIRDQDGDSESQDEFGNDLTFSGDDNDDLILLQLGAARDRRNSRVQPTRGSITRLNLDQSVPIGSGTILMNRVRVNHSQFFPVNFLRLTAACKESGSNPTDCPQTLAFNIQAGNIFGDLPPYEAFSIGGSNSVRGYGEGEVGSGRRFLQATAEYRFPVFSFVGGALFADVGTDLGSGEDVPGDPAGIREKPGSGYGVGLGVRVQSPLGPIRADYTVFTDDGDSRFQFGIGQRF